LESRAVEGVWLAATLSLAAWAWRMRGQALTEAAERCRERRLREELEAYAGLDPSIAPGSNAGMDAMEAARTLARRVCRTVAEKSAFRSVSMLLRDPQGRFACVGSVGTDDLTVAALHAWGEQIVAEERSGRGFGSVARTGAKSFAISLGEWKEFDPEVATWAGTGRRERRRYRRAIVTPIRTHMGRMVGAIVVCADAVDGPGFSGGLDLAMGPIETLAERLAISMENEALTARLLKTEKLAGLGQLAGGVAHALNNPLTAVLGFAELIAETSTDARVRQDAGTILAEARKMRETMLRLVEFWRPGMQADEPVDIAGMLKQLAAACADTLKDRGVTLEIVAGPDVPLIRGSGDRLLQVFEHLLNNAAQAIAGARAREDSEQHIIRVTLSHDERTLDVIVSDTGPGFREPGRVFDPFYTTKGPEQGAGLGLSICYGIVREHGGEISAFNLHPHGAAVVVELPVRAAVIEETSVRERERSKA
jgi:signal transduction histidine kinase